MRIDDLLVGIMWVAFWIYWAVSSRGVKKVLERANAGRRYGWIIFVFIVITLSNLPYFHIGPFSQNKILLDAGVIICALGLAFAVWARRHLGRNWNREPSIQEDHELVTSGPYQWVRHPIYTGMLTALLGSTLVGGPVWLVISLSILIVFIFRIFTEEGFMMKLFPSRYPEYKKRTKALIPFIW